MILLKKNRNDCCVYRYTLVETGEVIYIGKTDASLKQRIDAHEKEEKFIPYLGLWKIDYMELANNVETDIIEKYLINQLKPILNEKDCTEGLTSMDISLPAWISYEQYKEKIQKDDSFLLATISAAKIDESFFQDVYDAILSEKEEFVSTKLHPTGILPLPSGKRKVTKMHICSIFGGYKQFLNSETMEEIYSYPKQIQLAIWMPVAKLWNFSNNDRKYFDELTLLYDFASVLYEFRENGFVEEPDSERNILHIKTNERILTYYKELFSNVSKYNDDMYLEINSDNYDKIPCILEKIAGKFLVLFRITGIISYDEENNSLKIS